MLFLFSGTSLESEPVQTQWPTSFLDNAGLAHYHPEESLGLRLRPCYACLSFNLNL